jgi:effector-binding domain-containing protein
MLQNMIAFVEKNDIAIIGSPFITHQTWDKKAKTTIFSMCVPVEEEILTTSGSEISGGHFDEFLAVKTTLTGDYSHNIEAWNKTINYINKKKLIKDTEGLNIEVYKISLPKERKPSKWVTEIYIPVKKRVYIPKPKPMELQEVIGTSETSTTNTTK